MTTRPMIMQRCLRELVVVYKIAGIVVGNAAVADLIATESENISVVAAVRSESIHDGEVEVCVCGLGSRCCP